MLKDVLDGLAVRPGGFYVDGTIGGGGHTRGILEHSDPDGRVLGIDWDPGSLERARVNLESFGDRLLLQEGNYGDLPEILTGQGLGPVDGILLDLGASYEQLTSSEGGFSIRTSGPLDMRFSPRTRTNAGAVLNHRSEGELREIFRVKGEERWAGRIARAIVRSRPLSTTDELARVVARAVPGRRGRIHPATRVFQALRMEVNQELENIQRGIQRGAGCLTRKGRLCVITYHSLEDRLVKGLFRGKDTLDAAERFRVLTRKPVRPSAEEIRINPSARSAKLRILERMQEGI
jgi:16S rRNA (cytosine1402-N4)-methyltransferase